MSSKLTIRNRWSKAGLDLVLIVSIAVLIYALSYTFNLFDLFAGWSLSHGRLVKVDELIAVFTFFAVAFAFFSIRRWIEMRSEIRERKHVEEALHDSLATSKKLTDEATILFESVRSILKYQSFEDAARSIFESCKRLLGAKAGYIALSSSDGSRNEVVFLDPGDFDCNVDPSLPMPIRGMREEAYRTQRTIYNNNFPETEWAKLLPEGHVALENVLMAPLVIEGKSVGLLGLSHKPGGFNDADARIATTFAELAAIALSNSRLLDSLKTSQERFRSVAQSAPDAIISADSRGEIIFWNEGAEKMFGYKADEMTGKPLTVIMPERLSKLHPKGVARFLSTGESKIIGKTKESAGLRKDGTEFPLELSLASWKSGEENFFTGIIRDISERKLVEEKLARLASFPELNPNPIFETNHEGKITYLNPAGEKLFPDLRSSSLNHPLLEDFDWVLGEVYEKRKPQMREVKMGNRVFEQRIHSVPSQSIRFYIVDVTLRKRAERERERLLEELDRERQRAEEFADILGVERDILKVIMENTGAHLAYLDPQFNFIMVNSTYAQGSGHSIDELLGRNHFELFPNEENRAIFEKVRDSGERVEYIAKPFEFADQPERGVTYWDWTLTPVKDVTGKVEGLVLSLMDVTESIKLRRQIETSYEKQKEISRTLQMAFQPVPPPSIPETEIGVIYQSATEEAFVGGDFYDFVSLGESTVILLGDVAGKGVEASAQQLATRLYAKNLLHQGMPADFVLQSLNEELCEELAPGQFVSLLFILYGQDGEITWSSAGHPPPVVYRAFKKTAETLPLINSPPLGVLQSTSFEAGCTKLESGDVMLAYTDGLIEVRQKGELFGGERVKSFLTKNNRKSSQKILDGLLKEALEFGKGKLKDDLAMLCLKKKS